MNIIVATDNHHKFLEIKKILNLQNINLLSLTDFTEKLKVIENEKTFAENAVKKAKAAAVKFGMVAIADDSGLCVDALNGLPGVRSKRLVNPPATSVKLCNKLLELSENVPDNNRKARFVCAVAICTPNGKTAVVEKNCKGKIIYAMRGSKGFGFDPIFVPIRHKKTFAQMTAKEKNKISHRGKAFRCARKLLLEMLQ